MKDRIEEQMNNLIQQELAVISRGLKKEDIEKNKKESEKIAKKRIKLGLILNEFGEKNNLKVDEQELRNEMQKQVHSMPGQQKKSIRILSEKSVSYGKFKRIYI